MLLNDADLRCGGVWLVAPVTGDGLGARVVFCTAGGRGRRDARPRDNTAGPRGNAGLKGSGALHGWWRWAR